MAVCLLRFREEALELKTSSDTAGTKGLYWALVYFIAYFAVDRFIKS